VRNVSFLCIRGSYSEDHCVSLFVVGMSSWAHSAVFPNFPLCVLCLKSSHSQSYSRGSFQLSEMKKETLPLFCFSILMSDKETFSARGIVLL
jgi:hypothetical protein